MFYHFSRSITASQCASTGSQNTNRLAPSAGFKPFLCVSSCVELFIIAVSLLELKLVQFSLFRMKNCYTWMVYFIKAPLGETLPQYLHLTKKIQHKFALLSFFFPSVALRIGLLGLIVVFWKCGVKQAVFFTT